MQHTMILRFVMVTAVAVLLPMDVLTKNQTEVKTPALRNFHPILGFDCVSHHFVRYHHARTPEDCARACNRLQNCQAFSVSSGRCKKFVFNRCSKEIRSCTCNRYAHVFVKRQSGVPPGALCPADFKYSRCGVRYKFVHDTTKWDAGLEKCESESGLVIMAEPTTVSKVNYLTWLYQPRIKQPGDKDWVHVGGSQDPGSREPAGGWHWSTCRAPIAADVWEPGQPDIGGNGEDFACLGLGGPTKLNDCPNESSVLMNGAFCECASPFD